MTTSTDLTLYAAAPLAALVDETKTLETEAIAALGYYKQVRVTTAELYQWAVTVTQETKARWEAIDTRRMTLTAPIRAEEKRVNDLFRPALRAYSDVEIHLKNECIGFDMRQRAAQQAAVAETAALVQAGQLPLVPIPVTVAAQGSSIRYDWKWTITDPDLVPRQFCSPDDAKIAASRDWSIYNAQYPPPKIDGVVFYQEGSMTVRKA